MHQELALNMKYVPHKIHDIRFIVEKGKRKKGRGPMGRDTETGRERER